uniref:ABC transporter permease n=1 Tax=Panagrolaimus sp. PS1159 TaxID=55785 RepID=A0AC35GS47_9BILA
MGAGKALILMFMKDFRTLYRKKSSLIFEIFLIGIFVPLIWFGTYKLNGFIIDSPDKFVIGDQTYPFEIASNQSSITTKLYIRKDGNVDQKQFQNFKTILFERCKSLQNVPSADKNPDVIITVKSFSTTLNSPNFEYDLMLAKI